AIGEVEDQASVERRAAAALRRSDGAAGRLSWHHDARPVAEVECRQRPLRLRPDRLERIPSGAERQRTVQQGAPAHARQGVGGWRLGARGGAYARGEALGEEGRMINATAGAGPAGPRGRLDTERRAQPPAPGP